MLDKHARHGVFGLLCFPGNDGEIAQPTFILPPHLISTFLFPINSRLIWLFCTKGNLSFWLASLFTSLSFHIGRLDAVLHSSF